MELSKVNPYNAIKGVAANALLLQEIKPEDWYNEDGLLMCGICGEPRQMIMHFADPTEDDPRRKSPLLVTNMCRCDREVKADFERHKREEAAKALKRESLIEDKFSEMSFDDLTVIENNAKQIGACKRYINKFDEMVQNHQGLLLWGGVGTGKSSAAACIANALLAIGELVVMTSFPKLLELIQSDRDEETRFIEKMKRARLVVFDDLGAERNTDYALEKVYNIIDSRYRSGLPMILTTNLSLQNMKNETDIRYSRIYDRIFEVCYPIKFIGQSWRKKSAADRFSQMEALLTDGDTTERQQREEGAYAG